MADPFSVNYYDPSRWIRLDPFSDANVPPRWQDQLTGQVIYQDPSTLSRSTEMRDMLMREYGLGASPSERTLDIMTQRLKDLEAINPADTIITPEILGSEYARRRNNGMYFSGNEDPGGLMLDIAKAAGPEYAQDFVKNWIASQEGQKWNQEGQQLWSQSQVDDGGFLGGIDWGMVGTFAALAGLGGMDFGSMFGAESAIPELAGPIDFSNFVGPPDFLANAASSYVPGADFATWAADLGLPTANMSSGAADAFWNQVGQGTTSNWIKAADTMMSMGVPAETAANLAYSALGGTGSGASGMLNALTGGGSGGGLSSVISSVFGGGSGSGGGTNWLSMLTGGLGSYLQGSAAQDASQTAANAQIEAARIAADAAKFRPVGVTTNFGQSQFTYDPSGNLRTAGYTLNPQMKAQQDALLAASGGMLNQFTGSPAATAPMGQAAQTAMQLGQGYLSTDPMQQAQRYMADQQALLATGRERDLASLENRLLQQGRLGMATGGTSTGMGAANPELEAYYNAIRQQDLGLAANAIQGGMDYSKFGAGMVGTGGDLLKGMYGTQQSAFAPYQTALGGASTIEGLGQNAMDLGINIGAKGTAANAASGGLLAQGMQNAAQTMQPANAYSPWGALLSGLGTGMRGYTGQQQQQPWQTPGFNPYAVPPL